MTELPLPLIDDIKRLIDAYLVKRFYHENGKLKYKGDWGNRTINGKGTFYDDSGNIIYDGELLNGIPNGYGKIILNKTATYIGEIKDGNPHGIGEYKSTTQYYSGEFQHGKIYGRGHYWFIHKGKKCLPKHKFFEKNEVSIYY